MKTWRVQMRGEAWGSAEVQAETKEEAEKMVEDHEVMVDDYGDWEVWGAEEVTE